jgi:hypothetical protein
MLKTIEKTELATTGQAFLSPVGEALRSPRILDMKKGEALEAILDVISVTFFVTGQKADEKLLAVLSKSTYEEVKEYFKWLRVGEIKLAMAKGARGEYGDFYGLNIRTFHQWIKGYQMSEIRKEELSRLKSDDPEPLANVDRNKVSSDYWRTVLAIFEAIRSGSAPYIPLAHKMMHKMWKEGLIEFSTARAAEYLKQAENSFYAQKAMMEKPKTKKESLQSISLLALISAMEADQLTDEQDKLIKATAAEIAIKDQLRTCDEQKFRTIIQKLIDRK